jgi:hypothetical protein
MPKSISQRRGSVMLEFAMTGIPLIFTLLSLFWMSMGMWQYHTVAEAVNSTARIASVHGAGCVSLSCATTVDTVAKQIASSAIGIPASQLNVTLHSQATGDISCNPLSNCYGNSTAFPSSAANTTSTVITISATYQFSSAISLWSPHGRVTFNPITLGANSSQPIVF